MKDETIDQQYSYKPEVRDLTRKRSNLKQYLNTPVDKRLYDSHLKQSVSKYEKVMDQNQKNLKQYTFSPKVNNNILVKKGKDDKLVHDRLYKLGLEQEQKLMNRQIEKASRTQVSSPQINKKSEKIIKNAKQTQNSSFNSNNTYVDKFKPNTKCYDRLYQEKKRMDLRKQSNEVKVMVDMGCTFKPKINKKKPQNQSNRLQKSSSQISRARSSSSQSEKQFKNNSKHYFEFKKQQQYEL